MVMLNWIVLHWASWVVSGVFGFLGGLLGGTFKWFYPSRKEWREEQRGKAAKKLDTCVLEALGDPSVPRSSQGMTGGGMPLNRVSELSTHLNRGYDAVHESLNRLQSQGRARVDKGQWFRIPD
jgi:hypothetical protein